MTTGTRRKTWMGGEAEAEEQGKLDPEKTKLRQAYLMKQADETN